MHFLVGDYLAGMLIGAVTALAVRATTWPGMDMVLAMLVGMAIGLVPSCGRTVPAPMS